MRSATSLLCAGVLAVAAAGATVFAAVTVPDYIKAAVANSNRPERDTQRDVNRKPAEVLAFAGVKPGDKVGELMPGGGYFTRLFCNVVGAKGHVYTMNITATMKMDRPPPDVGGMGGGPQQDSGPACQNLTADAKPAAEFTLPSGLDVVWTSENYHDLHNAMFGAPDMVKFNKVIFNSLKPGGVYIVEDHAAAAGSGASATETLHRIDPEFVKKEVTSAGFVFEGASEELKNPADPHNVKVFELQGKSDKFLFKFRKPK